MSSTKNCIPTAMIARKIVSMWLLKTSSSLIPVRELPLLNSISLRRLSSVSTSADVNNDRHDMNEMKNASEEQKAHSEELFLLRTRENVRPARYALLLCYLGANYYGMQYTQHGPSIESKLFEAFVKAGYYNEETLKQPRFLAGYNRTSRTDSRVSALRQVVSIRLPLDASVEKINEYLPSDIRLLGMKRTTGKFDSQKKCDGRSYCYIMPTFAFCHYKHLTEPKRHYRIDASTLQTANQIFQEFKGIHRFHNYTEKRDHWDQRSVRRITDAYISNPYLVEDMEMVELHVTGDSFMLHQIRRMIGMTIAIMRGRLGYHSLQETFENPIMPTPTAPGLGLILSKQYFDRYNRKFGDRREPLEWDEYDEVVEKFKLNYIVPHIVGMEQREKSMEVFLEEKLRKHCFSPHPCSTKIVELKIRECDKLQEINPAREVNFDTHSEDVSTLKSG